MTIGQVLEACWKRSGKKQEDYAKDVMRCTREHFNAVTGGRQPGSPDMVTLALDEAKLTWDDVLILPPSIKDADEDAEILALVKNCLASGGEERLRVIEQASIWRNRRALREPKPPRPRSNVKRS